jgi:hypothetical protein
MGKEAVGTSRAKQRKISLLFPATLAATLAY